MSDVWKIEGNIEKATAMWTEGKPAAVIGAELGISRNAVIGKLHRLGLMKKGPTGPRKNRMVVVRKTDHGNKNQPKAPSIRATASQRDRAALWSWGQHRNNAHIKPVGMTDVDDGVDVTYLAGKPFADRHIGRECGWVLGDPKDPGRMCCGKPTEGGSSWCPEHHARVFQRPPVAA